MTDVNVTDLRQNLSSYLERVRRGERIRVTLRGVVIAGITAPKATGEEARRIRKRLRGTVAQCVADRARARTRGLVGEPVILAHGASAARPRAVSASPQAALPRPCDTTSSH